VPVEQRIEQRPVAAPASVPATTYYGQPNQPGDGRMCAPDDGRAQPASYRQPVNQVVTLHWSNGRPYYIVYDSYGRAIGSHWYYGKILRNAPQYQ